MARERTSDEILDEIVYVANMAMHHYGPALSEDGLVKLREAIYNAVGPFWCDSTWRVDLLDEDAKEFHELLPPNNWMDDFAIVTRQSRGSP